MDSSQTPNNPSIQHFLKTLEGFFHKYLYEAIPYKIPEDIKEFIVQYGPWIDIVILVISLPIVLLAFGLNFFSIPFSPFHSFYGFIIWITTIIGFMMTAAAIPGLFTRSIKSWYLIYYASLINSLSLLISKNFLGFIIGTALSIYVLFQVKNKYH